jgi:hypothetical protein
MNFKATGRSAILPSVSSRGWKALLLACLFGCAAAACDARAPCRKLADRDCDRHGENSRICRDARQLAATADPYLTEVCRRVLEGDNGAR